MTALPRAGLKLGIVLLVLFILIYGALFFIVQSAKFRNWIHAELSQRSGFEIRVANLGFRLPFNLVAEAVEATKPGELFFTADRLTASVGPFDVLSRTLHRVDVERPMLQLDIEEMMKSSTKTSTKLALRHLNVQEGTIVLKRGEATVFELPKINLAAENLNLGEPSGISLRADVPQLNGEAELRMTGPVRNLQTDIVIRPKQSKGLLTRQTPKDGIPELLRLRAKLHAPENQKADATIESNFYQLPIGEAKITGDLDASVEIDAGWTAAGFSGHSALIDFPKAIHPTVFKLPNGKAAASFAGIFALASKTLSLKSVELVSPFGTGAGEGELRFEPLASVRRAYASKRLVGSKNRPAAEDQRTIGNRRRKIYLSRRLESR